MNTPLEAGLQHSTRNQLPGMPCQPALPPAAAGEVLLGDLARAGFQVTQEHEDADAIIVNTCAFVEDAKSESLEVRGPAW